MLCMSDSDVFVCCLASKRLLLPVSDLMSVQTQFADSELSQSKIHIHVRKSCRTRLVEYFQMVKPSDLETDDAGKLLECSHQNSMKAVVSCILHFIVDSIVQQQLNFL